MLQAIGGSMLNPVAMSIITNTFTDKTERARAIGVWGGGYGLSMALGPVVGGLLVDSVGWRGTFWVNIPVGLVAMALTARFVPESRAARPRRPDPIGQALIIVMLGSLTYAIIEGPGLGWHAPVIMGLFAIAAVTLAVFVAYEARHAEPVLDPRFFRSAPFAGSVLTAISATAAVGGFLFLATLYLQDVRGMSALQAGLHMLPMATMMALGAVVSSRILARRGARLPMLAAGVGLAAGGVLLSRLTVSSFWRSWSSRSSFSASAAAWSTRRSRTPPCRACRYPRPAWPRASPRPAARSASASASPSPARSWPLTCGAARCGPGSSRPATPTGCCWPAAASSSSCSAWSRPANGRSARPLAPQRPFPDVPGEEPPKARLIPQNRGFAP